MIYVDKTRWLKDGELSYKATELENEWIFELVTSEVKVSFSSCSMGEMGRTRKVITRPKIEIKPRGFPIQYRCV